MTVEMLETLINGRWELLLPQHRAARPEWPWWEATRLAAMAHHIGPEDIVWDVGAEEGDFPALWASWGARVVLAEANPKVWPNIKTIFDANQLPDPMLCWAGFLGDTHTDGTWVDSAWINGHWPPSADGPVIGDHGFCQLGERPDLPSTSIDWLIEFAQAPPPTVITMDVEGSELHVLRGAERTLAEHRPKVFVSIHPEFLLEHYGIERGVEMVRNLMAGHGYAEQFLSIDHEVHWMFLP